MYLDLNDLPRCKYLWPSARALSGVIGKSLSGLGRKVGIGIGIGAEGVWRIFGPGRFSATEAKSR